MAARPACHKAAQLFGLAVDDAELDIGKADEPVTGFGFGDADRLAGQRLAEKDQLAAPFDLAIGAHSPQRVLGVVPRLLNPPRVSPRRGRGAAGRWGTL